MDILYYAKLINIFILSIFMFRKIKEKIEEYRRIIRVAVKPTKDEFDVSVKITLIGVGILGLIGFIMQLIFIFLLRAA